MHKLVGDLVDHETGRVHAHLYFSAGHCHLVQMRLLIHSLEHMHIFFGCLDQLELLWDIRLFPHIHIGSWENTCWYYVSFIECALLCLISSLFFLLFEKEKTHVMKVSYSCSRNRGFVKQYVIVQKITLLLSAMWSCEDYHRVCHAKFQFAWRQSTTFELVHSPCIDRGSMKRNCSFALFILRVFIPALPDCIAGHLGR